MRTGVGRRGGSVKGHEAVHVLGRVLEVPHAKVGVLGREDGQALEAAPPEREDERVVGLEDLLVPAMLLDARDGDAEPLLRR